MEKAMIDEKRLQEFVRSLPKDVKKERSIHLFEDTWRDLLLTLDALWKVERAAEKLSAYWAELESSTVVGVDELKRALSALKEKP
jgi:hypothetical protein